MQNVYIPVCVCVCDHNWKQLIIVEMLGSHLHEQETETRSQDQGSMKGGWSTTGAAERCDEERAAEESNNYLMWSTLEWNFDKTRQLATSNQSKRQFSFISFCLV